MPTEIVTTDDLREFKLDLIKEIKQLFVAHHGQPTKKWLKSYEVRSVSSMLSNKKWLRSSIFSKFNSVVTFLISVGSVPRCLQRKFSKFVNARKFIHS